MNAFTNLPLPVRIAIPAVLVLFLGLILWMTALRQPQPVEILKTKDYDVYSTAKLILEKAGLTPTESAVKDEYMLSVPPGDDVKTASVALGAAGIKDRTGMAKTIKCPSAPGFTATKAATEEYTNCSQAKEVQTMLIAAGATAANVKVSQEENGTLLGPTKSMNVVAQVFLPEAMDGKWNAEQAARTISRAVGTSIDRVTITDSRLQTMFDGAAASAAKAAAGTGAGGAGALSSLGCSDIAGATEVETKKAAVRSCYEQTIGPKLTALLGGSDRYVLTVDPTIGSVASQTTTTRNTQGPATSRSTQSGGGQETEDVATPPNTVERTSIAPAGNVTSLRISVILDKDSVTEDQKLAVQRLLSTQIDAKRGDPAPVVTMSQIAGGAGYDTDKELEKTRKEAESKGKAPAKGAAVPDAKTPTWMYAVLGLLVLGTAIAVAILLRRSKAMDAERARMEQTFSQEQKLFENFAQQNPDDLASDLNALFGAPSAPEPRY